MKLLYNKLKKRRMLIFKSLQYFHIFWFLFLRGGYYTYELSNYANLDEALIKYYCEGNCRRKEKDSKKR